MRNPSRFFLLQASTLVLAIPSILFAQNPLSAELQIHADQVTAHEFHYESGEDPAGDCQGGWPQHEFHTHVSTVLRDGPSDERQIAGTRSNAAPGCCENN